MPALLLSLLALLPCAAQDPVAQPAPAPSAQVDASRAEAELAPFAELAEALQSALEEGDLRALGLCIDVDALLNKGTDGVDVDPGFRRGFESGVRKTLLKSFLGSIQGAFDKGGALRLLRIRKQAQQQRLLFRLVIPEGGVDYIEFSTRKGRNGKPRIDDWFLYATGEWVSETLHHLYLPFAMQQQRGLIERLLGKDQLLVKHWEAISQLISCVQQGELEKGLGLYAALPDELRHDKFLLLLRLRLLTDKTDHPEYMHALEDLRRYCPGDPANELHAIDFHYIRKEWKRSAEAVRRLRESVGGDAYLDWLESTLLVECADLPGARHAVEHALEVEPDFLQAHWQLVTVCLSQKDHAGVLAALERIDTLFELEWNDLAETEQYKDFAASPQGAQWKVYLAAKK